MGALIRFDFEDHAVRLEDRNGEPWFVLTDVCCALGLTDASNVARRLEEDEKGYASITTLGGPQTLIVVNESGVYRACFASHKPAAKRFTRWIVHDVLPTIRRTGSYGGGVITEGRVVELIGMVLAKALPPMQGGRATTWAEVATDGSVSSELIDSLKLPPAISRRRVAGKLGAILRDNLARAGIPGPIKRGGMLHYPRSEAMRIAAEHRHLLVESCGARRDTEQGVLPFPGTA